MSKTKLRVSNLNLSPPIVFFLADFSFRLVYVCTSSDYVKLDVGCLLYSSAKFCFSSVDAYQLCLEIICSSNVHFTGERERFRLNPFQLMRGILEFVH